MLLIHLYYPLYISFGLIDTLYRVYLRDKCNLNVRNTIFSTIFDIKVAVNWVDRGSQYQENRILR